MSNSRFYQFFKSVLNVFDQNGYTVITDYGSSSQDRDREPPKDVYRIAYLIFFLQGVTMLLGWNGIL